LKVTLNADSAIPTYLSYRDIFS